MSGNENRARWETLERLSRKERELYFIDSSRNDVEDYFQNREIFYPKGGVKVAASE